MQHLFYYFASWYSVSFKQVCLPESNTHNWKTACCKCEKDTFECVESDQNYLRNLENLSGDVSFYLT